jgi:topoisomerase-4 subunit A
MTKGSPGSKVIYLSVHPNGEREVVTVFLRARPKLKKLRFDIDFSELMIKGRASKGNRVTKETINKIVQKEVGVSTLAARKIWFDDVVGRLNDEQRGRLIGQFKGGDKILTLYKSGHYRLSNFDLSTRFDEGLISIEKWNAEHPITAVYYEPDKQLHYVKRFVCEVTTDKMVLFIPDKEGAYLDVVSTDFNPLIKLVYSKRYKETKFLNDKIIELHDFIDVKGMKTLGNQLTKLPTKDILLLKSKDEELWKIIEKDLSADPENIAESVEVIEKEIVIEPATVMEEEEVTPVKKKSKEQPKEAEKKPVKETKKKEPVKKQPKKKIKLEAEIPIEVEFKIENPEVVELDSSEKALTIDLDVEAKPEKEDKPKSKKTKNKIIKPADDDEEDQMTLF